MGEPFRAAAVLGKPISHSLSPVLHRAAYAALGLTGWRYSAIECDEQQLAPLLRSSAAEVAGYSCTMPLKHEVLKAADAASPTATAIGAGNTLLRTTDGWFAENTDWRGVRDALAEAGIRGTGTVGIIGAGGTAQAVLAAVPDATGIVVLARNRSRAGALLASAERLGRTVSVRPLDDLAPLAACSLVVSTLPPGAADALAGGPWRRGQGLLDVAYRPWPSVLAASFARAGGIIVSGATMLLHQAAAQVELMTGRPAPVSAMRAALLAAVPDCGVRA